jgi:hypothetical protein
MRNEAQLAGVIAHESGHFLRRHMIRSWRDQRRKTDIFAIASMAAGVGGAAGGVYLGDYVQLAELGTLLSLFVYSREMEAEADAMGAKLIAEAGYEPIEMATIWQQLIGRKRRARATAASAGGGDRCSTAIRRRTRGWPTSSWMPRKFAPRDVPTTLAASGICRGSADPPMLLDDQVKLNDPGASQYLIETWRRTAGTACCAIYEGEVWRLRNRRATMPAPRRAMPRRSLSRCAGGRLAVAWHFADEGRPPARRRRLRPLSDDEARRCRRGLGPADDRLRGTMKLTKLACCRLAGLAACSTLGTGNMAQQLIARPGSPGRVGDGS